MEFLKPTSPPYEYSPSEDHCSPQSDLFVQSYLFFLARRRPKQLVRNSRRELLYSLNWEFAKKVRLAVRDITGKPDALAWAMPGFIHRFSITISPSFMAFLADIGNIWGQTTNLAHSGHSFVVFPVLFRG